MYEIFEQILLKKGLTPYKVAKGAGISQSSLSDWKNGKGTPKYETMKRISDFLGVPVSHLATGGGVEKAAFESLLSILQWLYDSAEIEWHCTISDGVPEYDGDYTVYLKKGEDEIALTKPEYEALLAEVGRAIPNQIQMILDHEEDYNHEDLDE